MDRDFSSSVFRTFPDFWLFRQFRLFDVPAFPDVLEFPVATTLLVGIDSSSRHRPPFWSASTTLLVGIDSSSRHRPFWSASTTLLVGIDSSSRH
jgi:hypothetical protein